MTNFINCLIAFGIVLVLSEIDSIKIQDARMITVIGWLIFIINILFFKHGGL